MENYSVLTTIYAKDTSIALKQCIDSMLAQTVITNDYVIVADGPISQDLSDVIISYKEKYEFINFVQMPENKGLGLALNEGLRHCKNDLVARLDADDISLKERCELQLKEFEKDPELAMVGSDMYEFEDDPNNINSIKVMPHTYEEVYKYGKRRNAFNHSSVMYKRSIVAKCGNYSTKKRSQDVELFSTILANKYKCININEPLIKYRTGSSQIQRRQKWEDVRSDLKVFYSNYKIGYSGIFDYLYALITHVVFFLLPELVANFLYKKIFRKSVSRPIFQRI